MPGAGGRLGNEGLCLARRTTRKTNVVLSARKTNVVLSALPKMAHPHPSMGPRTQPKHPPAQQGGLGPGAGGWVGGRAGREVCELVVSLKGLIRVIPDTR